MQGGLLFDCGAGFEALGAVVYLAPRVEGAGAFLEGLPELLVVAFLQLEVAQAGCVAGKEAGVAFELARASDQPRGVGR